ncbi:MAG: hypothetical protein PVF73_13480 [Bacteroidales bacterium]|jgi:hypothetical protein
MQRNIRTILTLVVCLTCLVSCQEKDNEIEYQDGYPNKLAGNWVAFEFPGAEIEDVLYEPYDLVTSLDPNRTGYLILDKLYDSDIRVRTEYEDSAFYVHMGEQLEAISTNTHDVECISIDGYVTSNPVLISMVYNFAAITYENISFDESDIEDVIYLNAGFYDVYETLVDTVLIIGYRKTGFEETNY